MENLSHSRQPNKGIPALPKKAYNGSSYAPGKATMYDDVFGGPPRYGAPTLSPRLEDYSEIFGGFQASRASSIPVLDLPLVDEDEVFFDVRSSGFDYCEVFGGFEGLDFAVSYDELLMGQSKGGDGDSSEDAWTPAGTESLSEGSDHSGKSQCFSNGGSYESIDGCTEFNISYNEASQMSNIGMPNGMTRVAGLSAVPGYTFAVDKTTSLSEEYENPHLQVTDDSSLNIDYTGGMMKGKHLRKTLSNPANHSTNGKTSADEFKQQKVYSRNSSCPREMFVSVSEISLRTRPSELPPPSRPPPVLDVKKEDPGTNSRTSAAEGSEGDSSPPYFDVEIDASSAAAVSAAAMKEAMEKAQAKIKSAKELMERKRDASHSHMKPGSRNGRKHKERIMNENVDGSCSIKDERASGSSEQVENQIKFSDQEAVPGSLEVEKTSNVARNSSEEKHVKKPWSPQGPKKVDGDDEWKEATEFFELVKTEKSRTTYERANSGEFLVLDEKYAHEHGLKEKWAAVEVLEQQQERKGKAVGEFPGVRKSEKKTEVGKEACERKDSNGRSGVATETHRQKRHDKKVKVAKDICQEEMEKKFNVAPKPVETEKKPTVADRSDKPGNLAKLKQEAKKVAAEEAMNNNESELRLKEANKSVESPKQAKESHGREVNGNRQKQVFEWGKNEKMLREALEQAENEKRLKEVFEQKENERRKKEACEREENVMRANKVCKQREDEKRLKEAFEQEEKERRVREALLQAENERRLKEALELEENERRLKEAHDKAEIDNRLKEALELEENERRLKEAREKAEIEKRLKEALELEENGRRLKEAREKAEIERRLKEAREKAEIERRLKEALGEAENERKLKEALEKEENERKLKKAREQAEMERRRKEALEQAENERRLTEALEKEENERKLKEACEQAEIERRLKEALEQAESERKLKQVLEKEENERKLKKACEQAEMEKRLKEALEQAENERRLTEALGKEENERRIEEALKKDKKQEVGAREREERETRLQEALKQEENDNKRKEAHEREGTQNRLKEACEKQKIEKQLEEVHEQLMLKEEYEEKDNGRILKSSGREEREMELQEAFQQEGNRDRKDACAGEDTERQLKDAGDREGLKGLNKTQKSTETDENGDKLEIDEGSHLQKDKGYLRVSDDEYKLDDKETLQATQLAGKHEKISQKLEKTQEGFLKENEQIRTELKDNEKKAQAVDMGDVLIDGKYIISGMSRSNVEHEESLSRKVDVKELLHQEDRLKKAGEVGFGVGLRNLGKAKGLPVMGSNMGNHEEKFAYEWEESGKNIKQAQAALNQQENKDKFMSSSARESVETGRKIEASQSSILEGKGSSQKTAQQVTASQSTGRKEKNLKETSAPEEKESERTKRERELEKERLRKIEEEREREREREKDRMAVDRLNAETRDRTERVAVDRATAEARQRALAEAREKLEKACAEAREKTLPEKASTEARLRAERAAVERATAEARERAAEKAASEARERMERSVSDKFSASSRNNGMRLNASSSDLPDHQLQSSASFSASRFQYSSAYGASYYSERSEGAEGESAQRCKARLERHRRTAERAAKALAEKNMRDLLAQREQAERNRLAETLDADVKRWSNGKEGNLRALLSTLQYILGPDSGWQPIPLTEVITSAAVKKAYRKATLCVHPDKLQQRGANIQQKYICEKVFDLLKEAWNKFNSEER